MVEQGNQVIGKQVHRVRTAAASSRTTETTQVRRDGPPAWWQRDQLLIPESALKWERMDEENGLTRTLFAPGQTRSIDHCLQATPELQTIVGPRVQCTDQLPSDGVDAVQPLMRQNFC